MLHIAPKEGYRPAAPSLLTCVIDTLLEIPQMSSVWKAMLVEFAITSSITGMVKTQQTVDSLSVMDYIRPCWAWPPCCVAAGLSRRSSRKA